MHSEEELKRGILNKYAEATQSPTTVANCVSGSGRLDVLRQLVVGPTWDGNVCSKSDRDKLVEAGIATRSCGFNIITEKGIEYALNLGLLRK